MMMPNADVLLFVCSGNFYRSRFAEAVFNHGALLRGLTWRAESRGFSPHLATDDLSPWARDALELRNIPLALTRRKPGRLSATDLERARRIVCVNEAEHRPALRRSHPEWEHRVDYWHIHDIDVEPPGTALPTLEQNVLNLLHQLDHSPDLMPRSAFAPASLEF